MQFESVSRSGEVISGSHPPCQVDIFCRKKFWRWS